MSELSQLPQHPVFLGWPTEGVEYWNAYWRHQEKLGFFDDIRID